MIKAEDWRRNIFKTVKEISSREFQELAWFNQSIHVSSPEELYCNLFDDHQYEDFLESKDIALTQEQKSRGRFLQEKMEAFADVIEDHPNPRDVINDLRWDEIRKAAHDFLKCDN